MLEHLGWGCETAEQYERWAAPFRENPASLESLRKANRLLRVLCYVLYPLLLVMTWLEAGGLAAVPAWGSLFWRVLLAPSIGFVLETALRAGINAPRPYEALDIKPLIHKGTKGKSFPSRHAYSVFAIATCWLFYEPILGVALLLAGCVLAWIRVLGGVHFPRDVIAGAALGIAVGLVGCLI